MTLFNLALTFILMHEMDAIRCKEWRIFPILSMLEDQLGYILFLFFHIPLFYWVFSQLDNSSFRWGMDIFLMIHVGLHLLFLKHKRNEFKDWISWSIIIGAGIFGGLDLWVIAS
jgi:hypothetical protein